MTPPAEKGIYRALLYLRISREDPEASRGASRESNSIANQKALILAYLRDKPQIRVVGTRCDDGCSGVDFLRPGFLALLQDLEQGLANCVIVKDLSRFGRNYIQAGHYLEKLFPALGIRFISVNDGYDSLYTDSGRDFLLPFQNLINDSYCRDLSLKIRSQLEAGRRSGAFLGAFAAYGYEKDPEEKNHLRIDPPAAAVVREIFRMKLLGASPGCISRKLNDAHILSPLAYKHSRGSAFETSFQLRDLPLWTPKAVSRILRDEVYAGVLIQGKVTTPNYKVRLRRTVPTEERIRCEGTHEAIIPPVFYRVTQALLARDTRASPGSDRVYPLSGLVFCGDCGSPMVRKTGPGGSFFLCRGKCTGGPCTWHRTEEAALLTAVRESLRLHFAHVQPPPARLLPDLRAQRPQEARERSREALNKARSLADHAYEDWKGGLLDRAEYHRLSAVFQGRISRAEAALTALPARASQPPRLISLSQSPHDRFRAAAVLALDRILIREGNFFTLIFRFPRPNHCPTERSTQYVSNLPSEAPGHSLP